MSYFKSNSIVDSLGNEVEVGLFGSLKVANPTSQISKTFDRELDTVKEFIVSSTGTGTYTAQHNRSLLKISSGTTGTASVESHNVLRYKTGSTIETYFTANWSGAGVGVAGHTAIIGLFDSEDGVYLGYSGTNFIVGYRNINKDGGTEPDVTQTVDMSGYTLTNIHRFRIRFGYLGVGNISFEIMDGTKWVLLHTFQTDASLSDRTHIGTAILPMRVEVSSASADITVLSGSWNAQTYDKTTGTQDKPYFNGGFRSVTPSTNSGGSPIVAFKSPSTFQSYTNKIHSQLLFAEFGTGSEGLYRINMIYLPAGTIVAGAPAAGEIGLNSTNWLYVDTVTTTEGNTPLQYNSSIINGTGTAPLSLTGAKLIFSTTIAVSSSGAGVASKDLEFGKLGIIANPNTEFVICIEEIIGGAGTDTHTWSIAYLDLV